MENTRVRGFEPISDEGLLLVPKMIKTFNNKGFNKVYINKEYREPVRATYGSAGSDIFYTGKEDIVISPGEKAIIITNVKAYMQPGEMLLADVRSSQGMFKNLMLCNTLAIIDKDYYNNIGNEGNISIALKNLGDTPTFIIHGDAVAQLMFVPYLAPDNSPMCAVRQSGFGSTSTK